MPSLHRSKKSQYWHCSYYDALAGKWRLRSTKSQDENEALAVCLRFEALSVRSEGVPSVVGPDGRGELVEAGLRLIQTAHKGELSESTAREFVNRVLKASGQAGLSGETVGAFLDHWLAGKKLSKAAHTAQRYGTTVESFKRSLGQRVNVPLSAVTVRDVENFRDSRLREISNTTVGYDLKILRTAFGAARKQGLVQLNPAEAVEIPKGRSNTRDAFSLAEVQIILASVGDVEWKTAILLGAYAGLRLGDAVGLDWSNIDFGKSLLRFEVSKTKRTEELPLHPVLEGHLAKIRGKGRGKVCPKLSRQRVPGGSGLSQQFANILAAAGIDRQSRGKDQNKSRGRKFSGKSFHSLRHRFVSALANAGVAPEVRQKLSGHNDANTHGKYTHLELETLRNAINSIPVPDAAKD
jgi:integrase